MHKQQPLDEWSFLRPDVLTDDDVLDTLIAANEIAPEEAALHIERSRRSRPAIDPGRAEVTIDPDNGLRPPTVRYFDDEEPERTGIAQELDAPSNSDDGQASSRDDHRDGLSNEGLTAEGLTDDDLADDGPDGEPDLEEILESQHYAFAPEAVETTFTAPERDGPV